MARIGIIVQGEGRGHQTQALAFLDIIRTTHHQVVCCLIGKGGNTQGQHLLSEVELPIIEFRSPYLQYDKNRQRLHVSATCLHAILDSPIYLQSIRLVQKTIVSYDVDVIINFYDIIGGVYNGLINRSRIPFIAVAHQYLHKHECFPNPKGHFFGRLCVSFTSKITSLKASAIFALSFDFQDSNEEECFYVLPPLIRRNLLDQSHVSSADLLCYVNLPEMTDRVIRWFKKSQLSCALHIYSSRPGVDEGNIYYHQLKAFQFVEHMKTCKLLICTAGFESVCEAFYLGRKCLLMPLPNHYEQLANAYDARRVGVAAFNEADISIAYGGIRDLSFDSGAFRSWADSVDTQLISLLERIMIRAATPRGSINFGQLTQKFIFSV